MTVRKTLKHEEQKTITRLMYLHLQPLFSQIRSADVLWCNRLAVYCLFSIVRAISGHPFNLTLLYTLISVRPAVVQRPISTLSALRTCTVCAMSNLLNANIDSGLMHSIGQSMHSRDYVISHFSDKALR